MTESPKKPVDSELEELIWDGIEGRLERADEDRLERWTASDAKIEEIRASCSDLAAILDRIETESPPPELRQEILGAIEARQALLLEATPSRPLFTRRARWAYLAAGFLLGAVTFQLATWIDSSPERFLGCRQVTQTNLDSHTLPETV